MKNPILLSLIIPSYNSQLTIDKLLYSINNSRFENFKNIETVIVDDSSSDTTVKTIKRLVPNLKFKVNLITLTKNIGPAKARNLGAKNALGQFLLFLDSDVRLKETTLKKAFELVKEGKIKAFTGIWDYHQKTKKFFPQFKALRDWAYWFIEREKNCRYYLFSTRVAGVDKKIFNKLGGFNEQYKQPTVEDIEFTYRLEEKVSIKFCADMIVKHEFEDFLPIAIKYFKRSRDWIKLFPKRLKFDPVATSKKEALKPISLGLIIFSLLIYLITKNILFIFIMIVFLISFILLELKFLAFLLKKRGWLFMLKSIPTAMVLYLIIEVGATFGLLELFFKSILLNKS